jgi:DNA-binding transcriptional LysR family regulator
VQKNTERSIEFRHLRYFSVLAEELHFARAAERLGIEQSPLSRAIRELERLLGVRLFERNTRSTRITRAGKVLVEYSRRAFVLMDQARSSTRSAALGRGSELRIGLSDCIAYCRIAEILPHFRSANPDCSISLHEMPLHQQIVGIRNDLLDASISLDGSHRDGIEAQAIASDVICAVVPIEHPLAHATTALPTALTGYPLVLFGPESDMGAGYQIDSFVDTLTRPSVAVRANSLGTMLTLVALGHGIGLVGSAQMTGVQRRDVVLRPIGGATPSLTTYVLHANCGVSEPLEAFIELARELFSSADSISVLS